MASYTDWASLTPGQQTEVATPPVQQQAGNPSILPWLIPGALMLGGGGGAGAGAGAGGLGGFGGMGLLGALGIGALLLQGLGRKKGPDPQQVEIGRLQEQREATGPTRPLGPRAQGGVLASPEAFETWLGNLPREMADATIMSAEQNAAMNAINQKRFVDWQNLMRGAYGEAMGAFGQMRGMYA